MAFSSEDIQRVREATDIVALFSERIPLRQRGRDFWCCCPFHDEKTPSCKVDPSTQLFYCFGCHKGGDVFKFVQEIEDIEFPDAVRKLADRAHIELEESGQRGPSQGERARLKDVCRETKEFYHLQLMRGKSSQADEARRYLSGRGFGGEVPKHWQLGFAPGSGQLVSHLRTSGFTAKEMIDANVAVERNGRVSDRFYNRVMFPIFDEVGDCIAFGGRVMGDGEPKYLNSQATPLFHKSRVLYGLDKAKSSITSTGVAIVVEGYTDVIACHEAGVTNVVATLGTALTSQHIRAISRHASKRIVYLFDGDKAGQSAADKALAFIGETMTESAGRRQIDLVACTLPDNLDPAEYIAAYGAESLRAQVDAAMPLIAFGIERRLAAFDLESAEGRSRAAGEALGVLAPIKDSLLAKDYAIQIASRLRLRESDLLDRLSHLQAPKAPAIQQEVPAPDLPQASAEYAPVELSKTELSRRNYESNLLACCIKTPALALAHAAELTSLNWHLRHHADIAQKLFELLAADPSLASAQLAAELTSTFPQVSRMLASAPSQSGTAAGQASEAYVSYVIEELAIGDLEEAIDTYRSQLSSHALSPEESDMLFQTVSALQKELAARVLAHSRTSLQ